jgi:RNA polymerase-binding transcription factor DksA
MTAVSSLGHLKMRAAPASRPAGPDDTGIAAFSGAYWRELLSARWLAEVAQVTELSLAFHRAAEAADAGPGYAAGRQVRQLEWQTVAARRALADTEEALGRLSAGRYGRCEQCAADIPADWLMRRPEARYCPGCSPSAAVTAGIATSPAFRHLLALLLAPALARVRRRLATGLSAIALRAVRRPGTHLPATPGRPVDG